MDELVKGLPPLIQFALLAGVGLGSAVFYWLARSGRSEAPQSSGWSSHDTLQGIYRVLLETRNDNARFANEHNEKADEQIDLLRDIKDGQPRRR